MSDKEPHPLLNKNVLGVLVNLVAIQKGRTPSEMLDKIHVILDAEFEKAEWLPGAFDRVKEALEELRK